MKFQKKYIIIAFIIIAIIITFFKSLGWNDQGMITLIQYPTGQMGYKATMGIYLKGFGQTFEYPKIANVSFGSFEGEKREGKEANLDRIAVAFRGSAKGDQSALFRVRLPETKVEMSQILDEFPGGYSVLLRKGLVPQCQYINRIAANLMEPEEALNNLSMYQSYIDDQLRNGPYKTKTIYVIDSSGIEPERKQRIERIQDSSGNYSREPLEISKIGCSFKGVQISIPVFDGPVQKAINERREASLNAETSKKRRIAAEQGKIAAEAEGQKAVIEEKYKQETALAETVIKAKMKMQADSLLSEAAKFKKKESILLGEGEAERKKLVMVADGALEKKLEAWGKAQVAWANAFAKYQGNIVPQIQSGVSNTKSGNGATDFMEIMGMKAAKDLGLSLEVKK